MIEPEILQESVTPISDPAATDALFELGQFSDMIPLVLTGVLVLTLVLSILGIISTISRIRSQVATVSMHKDIKAIRELLERNNPPDNTSQPPQSSDGEIAELAGNR